MLEPVEKKSLADAVFEQIRDRIVSGEMEPGSRLPAERALSEQLEVNRGAVREALKRLEQARLVSTRQGGGTRVLDFRQTAGTDLLAAMLVTADGEVDTRVARSVMEMRSAIAADVARLCARRTSDGIGAEVDAILAKMDEAARDLPALQQLAMDFWEVLVDGADNVAYRLAFNSLRETYDKIRAALLGVLEEELTDLDAYRSVADAIRRGDEGDAEFYARQIVSRGEASIKEMVAALDR